MTDLGRGDVVEAVQEMHVEARWTGGYGPYVVRKGQRAIVAEVRACRGECTACEPHTALVGLRLEEYPLAPFVLWCPCEWRKVGGSIDDTVAQFKARLSEPKKEPAKVGGFRRFIEKVGR